MMKESELKRKNNREKCKRKFKEFKVKKKL